MVLTNKEKRIFSAILIIAAFGAGMKGYLTILSADQINSPTVVDTDMIREQSKPFSIHKQIDYFTPTGLTEDGIILPSTQTLSITYDTLDEVAVDTEIWFTFNMVVREPDSINKAYVVITTPNYSDLLIPTKDLEKHIQYLSSYGAVFELDKVNSMTYKVVTSKKFGFEQDVAVYMFVNNTKHGLEFIPVNERQGILHINSYAEKLQIFTNRATLASIDQSAIDAKVQQRSNNVIEGISWVMLAIMLGQPAFAILYSISSDTNSRSSTDHKKWHMPFYD